MTNGSGDVLAAKALGEAFGAWTFVAWNVSRITRSLKLKSDPNVDGWILLFMEMEAGGNKREYIAD